MTDVTRRDSLKLAATASLAALAGTAAAQDPAAPAPSVRRTVGGPGP